MTVYYRCTFNIVRDEYKQAEDYYSEAEELFASDWSSEESINSVSDEGSSEELSQTEDELPSPLMIRRRLFGSPIPPEYEQLSDSDDSTAPPSPPARSPLPPLPLPPWSGVFTQALRWRDRPGSLMRPLSTLPPLESPDELSEIPATPEHESMYVPATPEAPESPPVIDLSGDTTEEDNENDLSGDTTEEDNEIVFRRFLRRVRESFDYDSDSEPEAVRRRLF